MKENGRTVIITGATSGIGRACCELLHKKGYNLLVTGRNEAVLKEICDDVNIVYICADITEETLPQTLIDTAIEKFGSCDVLINNAGMIESAPLESIDIDKVCQMIRVNTEAATRFIYTFAKYFRKTNHGHIISLSSILGLKSREYSAAYAGTKHAVEAISEGLRMELADSNVHISCVEPGLVETNLHRAFLSHPKESMNIPEPLLPHDIAESILYIMTRASHIRIPHFTILPKNHKI